MTLNPKQARFVEEYLIDLNGTQAAQRAGYSAKTAKAQGSRLLTNADVQAAVAGARAKLSAKTGITVERVLEELGKLGFSDIRKAVRFKANVTGMHMDEETGEERFAVTNEVQIVDSDQMDDDTAGAISEVSQTDKGGLKIKMHDKLGALNSIAKHLGMFVDRHEVTGKNGGPIETREMTDRMAALPPEKRAAVRAAIKAALET